MRTRHVWAAAFMLLALASPTLAGLGQQAGEPPPLPDLRTPVWSVAPRATGIILDVALGVPALPRRPVVRLPPERVRTVRVDRASGTAHGTGGSGSHSVVGLASYFCGNGSPCTAGYPGGLYAAAGPALRIGNWRGRIVDVRANGRSVRVRLIDFCACPRRLLDLYHDAFSVLADPSRGLLNVTVSW